LRTGSVSAINGPGTERALDKLEFKDPDIIRLPVQNEIMRSKESRAGHRLHGILPVTAERSCSKARSSLATVPARCITGSAASQKAAFSGCKKRLGRERFAALGEAAVKLSHRQRPTFRARLPILAIAKADGMESLSAIT
jgi:hypothetical protein